MHVTSALSLRSCSGSSGGSSAVAPGHHEEVQHAHGGCPGLHVGIAVVKPSVGCVIAVVLAP